MKVVLTLLVRDEVDVIESQIAFHLNTGVDFVIATDHRSRDGTTEILESYAHAGVLRLLREEGEFAQQAKWQSRMARLAALEHGADWVINSDADEFWWPRGSSLADVLDSVPESYGMVRALTRNFVPRLDDSGWFAERMTTRLATPAPINDPATPYRPVVKVVHRAHADVVVAGAHQVFGVPGSLQRDWFPIELLHFPLRSREQCAAKYRKTWTSWQDNLRGDLARAKAVAEAGRPEAMWDRIALDDAAVERGLAQGSLVTDVRLRDALRALPRERDRSASARALSTAYEPTRLEVTQHAVEAAVFEEAELVRSQRWVDEIAARVQRLEDGRSRVRRLLRS
jgi:Glycosyl transferase family 2